MQTMDNSPVYYRVREEQEREAALRASDDGIRQIHLAMADKYRELAKGAEQKAAV